MSAPDLRRVAADYREREFGADPLGTLRRDVVRAERIRIAKGLIWTAAVLLTIAGALWCGKTFALGSSVRVTAVDGAILVAEGCRAYAAEVRLNAEPVLAATIDCRPDPAFGNGFE